MSSEKRKEYNLKQLNIEVPIELIGRIKTYAVKRNIPARTWVLRALIKAFTEEDRD